MIKGRLIKNGNPSLGPLVRLPSMRPNISKAEARAITELKNIGSIIIKPADKGGAVVVMNSLRTGRLTPTHKPQIL